MSFIALILAYIGCLSAGTMLSMLLLLVAAYISAAVWLIAHGALYTGLLYVLVYVGAIVVLIMFVVQLTNTNLSEASPTTNRSRTLSLTQNAVLLASLVALLSTAGSYTGDLLVSLASTGISMPVGDTANVPTVLSHASDYEHALTGTGSTLYALAGSIFNEYGYILVLSVHAIVLAVIGPIKLAISDME